MVMPYHLHMPSYFLETFTEYPEITGDNLRNLWRKSFLSRLFAILYSAMH